MKKTLMKRLAGEYNFPKYICNPYSLPENEKLNKPKKVTKMPIPQA